jgi:hypothetical protein
VGARHRAERFRPITFTANLPLSPFLLRQPSAAGNRSILPPEAEASGFCSIVGSVARSAVSSRAHPVLPWACPSRPPRSLGAPLRLHAHHGERGIGTSHRDALKDVSTLRRRPLRRAPLSA